MNTLEKWNPFRSQWDPMREMEEMQNRLVSLFGRRMPLRRGGGEEGFTLTEWAPPVDISEDDKEYTIKAELPGVHKEDVKVMVEGGVLSISGERKAEKEEKNKKYHRIERSYGTFVRSFTLPEGTAGDRISAEFRDGILQVRLPKDEHAKSKSIDVDWLVSDPNYRKVFWKRSFREAKGRSGEGSFAAARGKLKDR